MTCPGCGREILATTKDGPQLFCVPCLKAKGYRMLLDFQRLFIAQLAAGDAKLVLQKKAQAARWHLRMISYPQAFCGCTVSDRWRDKDYVAWPSLDRARRPLCERCVEVFEQLAAELADGRIQTPAP